MNLYNIIQRVTNFCFHKSLQVIKRLKKRYGEVYDESNVIISGTHTHSTPGGFLMDFLFDLPILGFVKETFAAYVAGIYKVTSISCWISIGISYTRIYFHFAQANPANSIFRLDLQLSYDIDTRAIFQLIIHFEILPTFSHLRSDRAKSYLLTYTLYFVKLSKYSKRPVVCSVYCT